MKRNISVVVLALVMTGVLMTGCETLREGDRESQIAFAIDQIDKVLVVAEEAILLFNAGDDSAKTLAEIKSAWDKAKPLVNAAIDLLVAYGVFGDVEADALYDRIEEVNTTVAAEPLTE